MDRDRDTDGQEQGHRRTGTQSDKDRDTDGQGKGHKQTRTGIRARTFQLTRTTYKKIRTLKALRFKKLD
jgi:hypothetical protein